MYYIYKRSENIGWWLMLRYLHIQILDQLAKVDLALLIHRKASSSVSILAEITHAIVDVHIF